MATERTWEDGLRFSAGDDVSLAAVRMKSRRWRDGGASLQAANDATWRKQA